MKRLVVTILAVALAMGMPISALAMKHMVHAEHGKAMADDLASMAVPSSRMPS